MSDMLLGFRPRPLGRIGAAVVLVASVAVLDATGCGLSTEGAQADCTQAVDCVDDNPCNVETCTPDSECSATPLPDGPALAQIPGDCKQAACEKGAAVQADDPTDVDDGKPCTEDSCDGGEPQHTNLSDVACEQGAALGVCVDGICIIKCKDSAQCDDGNPCTNDSCDTSLQQCVFEANHGAFVSNDDPEDCLQKVCNQTLATDVPKDEEIPDDDDPCTQDSCAGGVEQHPFMPEGTSCGGTLKCNKNGVCVGCVFPSDCPEPDTECQTPTCDDSIGACGVDYEPEGSLGDPALPQTGADCLENRCNGSGDSVPVPVNEPPAPDGNPCHGVGCSAGTPIWPPLAPDTPCPGGVCNQTGVCVDCNNDGHCGSPPLCKSSVCDANNCTYPNIGAGNDPNGNCSDQGSGSCGTTGACNGSGACALYPMGTVCGSSSCGGPPPSQTSAPTCNGSGSCGGSVTTNCNTGYTCTGGACNTSCTGNSQCTGPNYVCQTSTSTCKLAVGQPCPGGNGDCANNQCRDGYCCNANCATDCFDCNLPGNLGTCVPNPLGAKDGNCNDAAEACDGAGTCKLSNGQACNESSPSACASGFCEDDTCCNVACTTDCYDCNEPGQFGTCTPVPNGEDDGNCNGGSEDCNGAGVCI